ncbi:MAG: CapA family protein [Erysipelotrichaceae bacterium]|nr:CapA family protein [Erysipelotrichaceae bacterium]
MKYLKCLLVLLLMIGCTPVKEQESEVTVIPPQEEEEVIEDRVSFSAVGDNIMHTLLLEEAKTDDGYDFTNFYTNIASYIRSADLSFVNQETVLAGGTPSGYPEFDTPDEMAETLNNLGFDIVNGSTNHALDKGLDGLLHSISVFEKYDDITYIGLYKSQSDRDNIKVIEFNGIKIAFLAYNQTVNDHTIPNSYCINFFDEDLITSDVKKAKELADFVIVSCHWGNEDSLDISEYQTIYAKLLASLDVDVILGTHTHTLQDIVWLDGNDGHQTLCAYSLGNFLSGMMSEESQLGGMLSFDLVKDEEGHCSIEDVVLTPLVTHYYTTDVSDLDNTRYGFTVYRLKDYTETLASRHGLNGYEDITISISYYRKIVNETISSDIEIRM